MLKLGRFLLRFHGPKIDKVGLVLSIFRHSFRHRLTLSNSIADLVVIQKCGNKSRKGVVFGLLNGQLVDQPSRRHPICLRTGQLAYADRKAWHR